MISPPGTVVVEDLGGEQCAVKWYSSDKVIQADGQPASAGPFELGVYQREEAQRIAELLQRKFATKELSPEHRGPVVEAVQDAQVVETAVVAWNKKFGAEKTVDAGDIVIQWDSLRRTGNVRIADVGDATVTSGADRKYTFNGPTRRID